MRRARTLHGPHHEAPAFRMTILLPLLATIWSNCSALSISVTSAEKAVKDPSVALDLHNPARRGPPTVQRAGAAWHLEPGVWDTKATTPGARLNILSGVADDEEVRGDGRRSRGTAASLTLGSRLCGDSVRAALQLTKKALGCGCKGASKPSRDGGTQEEEPTARSARGN